MTDMLFDIPASETPRQKWIKKHDIETHKSDIADRDEPWSCWQGDLDEAVNTNNIQSGKTEDEAIVNYCKDNGILLWNEESYAEKAHL